MKKLCILDGVDICTNCGKCRICDLDPHKTCDNCCKCIDYESGDYRSLSMSEYYSSKIDKNVPYGARKLQRGRDGNKEKDDAN